MLGLFIALSLLASSHAFQAIHQAAMATALNVRSKSVPFLDQPPALSGKYPGDVGFDPLGLSSIYSDVSFHVFVKLLLLIVVFPWISERLE
jgi:hypothetical protein